MNLKEEIIELIDKSIEDEFLAKAEKRQIKQLLYDLEPDKNLNDVLRSEFFKIAKDKIGSNNYMEVIHWIENMNKLILSIKKTESLNERVYFSPGEECLNAIINQIRQAKQVIRICLFTISDNRISNELINKHKNGVSIKLITDNDKVYDKGSDIRSLNANGLSVKVDVTNNHMHHKFALFDRQSTLTGSYNWTRSAERYNHENILLTNSKKIHDQYEREFEQLWDDLVFFDKI